MGKSNLKQFNISQQQNQGGKNEGVCILLPYTACVYIYIYIYTHICMYVYIYVCMYIINEYTPYE